MSEDQYVTYFDEELAVEGSSNLYQVWYDKVGKRLFVEFHSGSTAGYGNVSESVWEAFKEAIVTPGRSAGQFYNRFIRGNKALPGINTDDLEFYNRPAPTNLSRFTVSGTVRISLDLEATSLVEAIKAFSAQYPDATIKEATVKFD